MENFLRWKTPFKQRRPFPESFVGQALKKRYSSNRQKIDGSKVEISILINWNLSIFSAKRTNSEKNSTSSPARQAVYIDNPYYIQPGLRD